jgi:hypothetical protein
VPVPRIEDYAILKLLAAAADVHRRTRDLADVQYDWKRIREQRRCPFRRCERDCAISTASPDGT